MHGLRVGYAWLLILAILPVPLLAQDQHSAVVPAQHHEWGRFPPGSWKRVRQTTERLGVQGDVQGSEVIETTTTLLGANRCSCTLRVETVVEVGGRRFAKPVQTIVQTYDGAVAPRFVQGERVDESQLPTENLRLAGRQIRSRVRTWVSQGPRCRLRNRVFYSQQTAPYVVRREVTAIEPSPDLRNFSTTTEVVDFDAKFNWQGEDRAATRLRTTLTSGEQKVVTEELRLEEVPGGFVWHASQRFDGQKRLVGRSNLQLVDYFVPESRRDRPRR